MEAAAEQANTTSPEQKDGSSLIAIRGLSEILEQHAQWLDTNGDSGFQANFSLQNLEGSDLIDARLQDAIINRANLKRADLMLADLRGASLLQADLQDANLLGTGFQQANLQAANLHGATGLSEGEFAGANLFGTVLPEETSAVGGLKNIAAAGARAGWLLASLLLLNALAWLRIFTTADAQILQNAPALPFLHLQADLPFVPFYLFGPVFLLCAYVGFHLFLQRLWDGAAQLPAIFPNGDRLDACLPWFAKWSARRHFKWLRNKRSPLAFLEAGIAMFLLYWVTPATVLLFWGRYLTLEDLRGTAAHVLLVAGAVAAAINFPRMVGKAFGADLPAQAKSKKSPLQRILFSKTIIPFGIGFLLLALSAGTILGAPHVVSQPSKTANSGIETWAADLLWTVGFNPFPQLTDAEVSTKPSTWTGKDADVALVKGANLNRMHLRYAQGYGAFLVKARLWEADLRNAYLSEADMREANLRQADLRFAVLDRTVLTRASLQETDLRNANFNRAEMRDVNLSSAIASGGTFLDATLDSANLYKADFSSASLQRVSLKQADLREANFENANLAMANFQEAYLTSTRMKGAHLDHADLSLAFLTDIDLRNSDLSGADLRGAILRGANLTGANLQNANLIGAVGATAEQICSAANFAQIQLDDSLKSDVQTLCGDPH